MKPLQSSIIFLTLKSSKSTQYSFRKELILDVEIIISLANISTFIIVKAKHIHERVIF